MNEFLLWHTLRKEFVQPYRHIVFDDSGIAESDLCTIHIYIGMDDINNNKIYADCSIVEFTHKYLKSGIWEVAKLKGIFTYFERDLKYVIRLLNNDIYKIKLIEYDYHSFDFEIIDTIQENKLGFVIEN